MFFLYFSFCFNNYIINSFLVFSARYPVNGAPSPTLGSQLWKLRLESKLLFWRLKLSPAARKRGSLVAPGRASRAAIFEIRPKS